MREEAARSGKHVVEAVVDGFNKRYCYVRVPYGWGTRGLTLSRSWLSHGYAQHKRLLVDLNYDTMRHTSSGWWAKMTIVGFLDAKDE